MTVTSSTAIFGLSLLAIPITYAVNTATAVHGEVGLFVVGSACLSLLCFLTYLIVGRKNQTTDPIFYVFILGTFASVVDLIIGLENDGLIHGFMTQYLKEGEPYLKTAYGTIISYWDGTVFILGMFSSVVDLIIGLENDGIITGFMTHYLKVGEPYLKTAFGTIICYWDGIGHYGMYLMMLSAHAWNQSYREVGLYWAGSIGHSMLVLIPGSIVGKYGVKYSILLNTPYMIFPFTCAARFLGERHKVIQSQYQAEQNYKSIWKRPLDLLLIAGFIASIIIACFRAFAVLGADVEVMKMYVDHYEPYLTDPSSYPKVQMLVYFFYFVPYYILSIYGLLYPGQDWMPDWSLLFAGAALQAQVGHIGSSIHKRTPYILRVPRDGTIRSVFWAVNLFLLIFPQIHAHRCVFNSQFFVPAVKKVDQHKRTSIKYE